MAEASFLAHSRDRRSLADLIAWMNAQPRKPGYAGFKYHHRYVRKLLEEAGVPLYQRDADCKVWFRAADLRQHVPLLAKGFLGTGSTADAYTRTQD